MVEAIFFSEAEKMYPEFEAVFRKETEGKKSSGRVTNDLISYISEHSTFLNKKSNEWMKSIVEIVRRTSMYFQPQIRTKILNEGWASYWHEKLFLGDDRIKGHEVDFAQVNARVLEMQRVGLNPYALGWRLLMHVEDLVDKGKLSYEFQKIQNSEQRKHYDEHVGEGRSHLFELRRNYSDFMFINDYIDQDFVDKYELFVVGRRLNQSKGVWEYYVKSRDAVQYKQMVIDSMHHPPFITIEESKMQGGEIYLNHHYEGKPLVKEYVGNTMMGIEYLYGGPVKLETSEVDEEKLQMRGDSAGQDREPEPELKRVLYTMKDRKLTRKIL